MTNAQQHNNNLKKNKKQKKDFSCQEKSFVKFISSLKAHHAEMYLQSCQLT